MLTNCCLDYFEDALRITSCYDAWVGTRNIGRARQSLWKSKQFKVKVSTERLGKVLYSTEEGASSWPAPADIKNPWLWTLILLLFIGYWAGSNNSSRV